MIKVLINKKNNIISKINITGHANSDVRGKDLVCAGVSASSVGVINALNVKGFIKDDICTYEMRDGYIDIEIINSNDIIQVILETLVVILITIEESNKKYIRISNVEV